MLFDKNRFKENFRAWVNENPAASEEDALLYCQAQIPAKNIASQYWLVEQSVQWFTWLKTRRTFDGAGQYHDDESEAKIGKREEMH